MRKTGHVTIETTEPITAFKAWVMATGAEVRALVGPLGVSRQTLYGSALAGPCSRALAERIAEHTGLDVDVVESGEVRSRWAIDFEVDDEDASICAA